MRPHIVAVLLGVLFVLSALTPAAQAAPEDEDIPMMRIFFEKDEYVVGEQVNISAEVTANGRFVNPDVPPNPGQDPVMLAILMNFTFGGPGGPGDIEWITMDSVLGQDGRFTGNFIIKQHHIVTMEPQREGLPLVGKVVFMMAMCSYYDVQVTTMALIMMEEGPSVNVAVSDHFPSPGDRVTVTVETTNGTPVDAAAVKIDLSSYDGIEEKYVTDLSATRKSIGVYEATYTVPVDLTLATLYSVSAGASFTEYNASAFLYPLFGTGFMVNFFDVWFQNVSATDDETDIAMWIADMDGNALEGIDIDLEVMVYTTSGGMTSQNLTNTTAADGQSRFVIAHASAERVDVNGSVTDGDVTQRFYFEGVVDRSQPEPPEPENSEDDLQVEPWEESEMGSIFDMVKEPGDPIHVKYRVFNATGPVLNKRINWYLIDRDGFFDTDWTTIDSGFEVTDGNGDFDLTFTVPDNDVNGWLMFEAVLWSEDEQGESRVESSEPLIDAGFFARDENIEITVDRVHKDNPVELRAKVPLPDSYYIGQFFAVYDEDTGLTDWGQPQALGPQSDDFNIMPLPKIGVDTFGMDKQLPEFFPEDQSIAFMVLSVDLEAFKIQMNYVMLGYGESTTKGVDAIEPTDPQPIAAGSNGTAGFDVENTGAGTDRYTIEQMTGPDWFTWEEETITIEPSETGSFAAVVAVPEGINEGRYYYNITVTSETDDTVTENLEMWVDVIVNGVAVTIEDDEADAMREDTVNFVVTINNTGQGNDTYSIALSGDAGDWATPSHTSISVPEGGEVEVVVQVSVPSDANEATYGIDLTATSSDGETADGVSMSVHVSVDGVDVDADEDLYETWRETTVEIAFSVTNTGQGADTFTFTIEGDEPGWAVLADETLEVAEGETETLMVEVTPPIGADAGFYNIILVATSSNGITNASATTSVHVWVTGVTIVAQADDMEGYRGDQIQFDFDITNTGQERDVFTISYSDAAWAESVIPSQTTVALDPDESGVVSVTVILSDTIDEGDYMFSVSIASEDGITEASTELTVDVTVNGVEISLSETSITITKGETKEVTLTITNTGQGSDTFSVLYLGDPSNWTEADRTVITLDEGASETVTFTISPGKDVKGDHAILDITVVSSDPNFNDAEELQIVLKEAPEEEGSPSTAIIAIVAVIVIIVAIMVYMMQARGD
jgi:uncharacterized membrane protein